MVPARAAMGLRGGLVYGALCAALAGCGPSIGQINARPDKYYQKKVDVVAQIRRMQQLEGEVLLELADASGRRILVRATGPLEVATGDWVKVRGILVPEVRVADAVLYDIIVAEHVRRTRAPWLPDFT